MHLSIKHSQAIDDAEQPVNPSQSPADILLLSFTDSDLACMAEAAGDIKNIRLTSLDLLKHPLSVDLYIEQVASHAKVILVRLLGGYSRWQYGTEEFAKLARSKNIKLIMVSACGSDRRLTGLSTVAEEEVLAVENCFAQGGICNFKMVMEYLHCGAIPEAKPVGVGGLYREIKAGDNKATIIFYRAHYLAADTQPIDAMLEALAARAISARAFMLTSLKDGAALELVKSEFSDNPADVIIDATAFSAGSGVHPLAYLDIPILQVALANMSFDGWKESKRGLSTSDMAMQVVLPEADGRIFTRAISFKAEGKNHEALEFSRKFNDPEAGRVEYVAALAAAWINLRKKKNSEKKLALILSDYPQRGGRKGYAVGLDAMASVEVILEMLEEDGYAVDGHMSWVVGHEKKITYGADAYRKRFAVLPPENQQAVIALWGNPPTEDFFLPIQICGNVAIALQPDRGSFTDKKTGYHDSATPPNHHYLAFYFWLREEFTMDALIHLGTHGNLEWLPAKTVALSENCWPEVVLGTTPVIYPYIVSDAGEATQAKRRISAVIISHLTPPVQKVELTPELAELEALTDEYSSADGLDGRRMKLLRDEIIFRAKKSGLTFLGSDDSAVMTALEAHLCDIKEQRVGDGLHIFGCIPSPLGGGLGWGLTCSVCTSSAPLPTSPLWGEEFPSLALPLQGREHTGEECAINERKSLLAALSGKFIMPSSGGAPSRGRMDIFPTGRNLIGVDPRTIPTKTASVIGKRAAADFVRRYMQDHGDYPKNIMMDIWGSTTLRSGGDEIAQALALMGVDIVWDEATQRVLGFEIIPDSNMEWSRIDVTLRISGLFRDMFPNLILLFDDAVQAIIRLQGRKAAWRIFGNSLDNYGAGAISLIDSGTWQTRADLGQAYLDASNFAYGRKADGVLAAASLKERIIASDALLHIQDLREVDVLSGADFADSEGGFAAAADMLGSNPTLYHIDTSNPDNIRTRTLAEEISLTLHSRAINPEWIKGQMRHGYAGGAALADVVDNLFALAATSSAVTSAQFELVADAYLHNEQVCEFLQRENPEALKAIAARFNEAVERGLWQPLRNSTRELLGYAPVYL